MNRNLPANVGDVGLIPDLGIFHIQFSRDEISQGHSDGFHSDEKAWYHLSFLQFAFMIPHCGGRFTYVDTFQVNSFN